MKRILVVDDDINICSILKYKLNKEGYEVLLASDGFSTLEKAREERPDLIILDIMMPKMDGFETLRRLKSNSKTLPIPVIVLTVLRGEANRARSRELGAVGFISKPFSLRELVSDVKEILETQSTE
jgi:DNA-binding response OmpR family regulator